ncbi:TetR/AcrR family transcriptional regulator [Amycolatopsis sp. lyj-109]|jgi:AcrR family transcriptional regulator|uniref:TetR/AcrR family transcriptional regulator n=1 Tax=Amycolatopsis sp. lyj-109 TaxID=2789287 RepID=UPI00397DCF30
MRPGLRERKKQEARQRISEAATSLFLERGFDDVTIAEIAEAAGYSKVTVFNYFPRKEDMFLDLYPEAEELLVSAIRQRPPGQSPVDAVRGLLHRLLREHHPLSGALPHMKAFAQVVADSAALRSRARERRDELAGKVAELIEKETGDPYTAALTGNLLLAAVSTVVITPIGRLLEGRAAKAITADQPGVIDRAFDLLTTGIGDIGANTPPPQG